MSTHIAIAVCDGEALFVHENQGFFFLPSVIGQCVVDMHKLYDCLHLNENGMLKIVDKYFQNGHKSIHKELNQKFNRCDLI